MDAPVAIIGGGISGLSAAYYLTEAGVPCALIESRARLGGVIQSEKVAGCVIEGGPDSFLSMKPAAMDLIRELGLADEVIGSNDHLRVTYVWKGGRLVPLPDGLQLMVPTKLAPLMATRLLSWRTKFRMGMELFHPPGRQAEDQSVAEFVTAHYGVEAVDYLAEPLLSGIYGGSPNTLSISSVLPRFVELEARYGSLTKGVLAELKTNKAQAKRLPLFRTLKGGLGQLIAALAERLEGRVSILHSRAEAVERTGGGFRIRLEGGWLECAQLVVACEAYNAAALVAGLDGRLADLLGSVPYSSSMTVAMGFPASAFPKPLDGFGFLVPKRERRRLVACTWVGTKFSHRVPSGTTVARCFLGGMDDGEILEESDEAVLATVLQELHEIVGFRAAPAFSRIFRWPRSMAQYTVGHAARVKEIAARASAIPGLQLAGNAYTGIGIPDCIRMGKQAAEAISKATCPV
ncbi:MAG TPA: protoporphyrinogen oxidase [Bryobacteraceae bacterium]|jgi:oxygen-dependent protoporphyrinogen oxidase|nr:protoporphyrinogen oxidase [Bryobacteraceae bacterium]